MDILSYTFVHYAFAAGLCMAVLAGLLGPMVVSGRQSVVSDMLAHTALAGVGLAAVFSISPLLGAFSVIIFSAALLWWITIKETYTADSLSMFFLSGGLAIALALIHAARNQSVSFESYLFGSILTVTGEELAVMTALTAIAAAIILFLWYPLLGAVQSPPYRIPYSRRPHFIQLIFFLLLALTVWVGIKTVGGLLAGALLVIPPLTVRAYASSFRTLTILSLALAIVGVLLGLTLALFIDIPPSSVIILTFIVIFILSSVVKKIQH